MLKIENFIWHVELVYYFNGDNNFLPKDQHEFSIIKMI